MKTNQITHASCPNLGLIYDRASYSSFPSIDNACYHVQPIKSPALTHQHEFCLTKKYAECPIYTAPVGIKLPEELQQQVEQKPKKKSILLLFGFIIILSIAILLGVYWKTIKTIWGRPSQTPTQSQTTTSTELTITNTATITKTSTPTDSIPSITPTQQVTATIITPSPSLIPTEVRKFNLESVIGQNPQFMIHRVIEGESLQLYADLYDTSIEAIRAVNYKFPLILWIDQIVIIPLNLTDVSGIPPFTAYEIVENGITFEQISEEFSVPLEELLQYNSVNKDFVLQQGDWILVPQIGN